MKNYSLKIQPRVYNTDPFSRSTSCPQCRKKTTAKTIHRIYFNFPNTENITQDAETLQLQLDSTKFQLQEAENHLLKNREETERLEEACLTSK